MKLKVLGWIIPMALVIIACGEKKKEDNFVIFSGQVKNATTDSIYINLNSREKGFALDFDGNFSDTIQIDYEGYKSLAIDREEFPLYLIPNDSLFVKVDLKDVEATYFLKGKGAERNNYLFEKQMFLNQWMANDNVFRLDEDEYRKNITDFSAELRKVLKEKEVEKSFETAEHRNIYFDEFNLLYMFHDSYAYFHPTKPQLPVDFLNFSKFNLDNENNFNQFQSYRTIVAYYLDEQLNRGISPLDILEAIKSENIRYSFIRTLIDNLDPSDASSRIAYEAIQKYCKYKPWIDEANKIMDNPEKK
jgi:hypothetical protein